VAGHIDSVRYPSDNDFRVLSRFLSVLGALEQEQEEVKVLSADKDAFFYKGQVNHGEVTS
jgi:hypothetical protein